MSSITSYVALGDSFTEGLNDHLGGDRYRGWADRLAELLAAREPGFRYANLAVRGRLIARIADEQVPQAEALAPDLVSLCAGGNDILRPGGDPDAIAAQLDAAVGRLCATGARVLLFTGFDLRQVPVMRLVHHKIAVYNLHIHDIATRHGCTLVDLWAMGVLRDRRAWSEDRLHLSADGHRRIALRAAEALGLPVEEDWREPYPPLGPSVWAEARKQDLRWARMFLAPWVNRRLQGRSSGDGLGAKRPELAPVPMMLPDHG
ncbi:SGNH/GDSL hydrolase family protein [Planomonospora parontospora]|uniref:SGNH/GDSL hydrolase family protein n=1 Tax=Planomonospora parontospora TaxID=58119 RepID=UPI0016711BE7|nr:SGNH/GDSL hydrolase family protein [Planomonospora parontospora]GGL29328.1 SGNH hydrolase [Planomonospora parontospora subsp. antibiotica]GII19737.1 SGNH hydrolase [Planomonospora parontospora subsp. antibiotica]